eukprot:scaffold9178_cov176-Amphora_coffeaeformis.AAC.18
MTLSQSGDNEMDRLGRLAGERKCDQTKKTIPVMATTALVVGGKRSVRCPTGQHLVRVSFSYPYEH